MDQDLEQQVLYGNLAVHSNTGDPVNNGDGSIEAQGTIYTDRVKAYTTNGGTVIHDTEFKNSTVNLKLAPTTGVSTPAVGGIVLYADPVLKRVRQKDSSGNTTALVSTKGDLLTFNGTSEAVLPVSGTNGYVLTSNSSTSTGLEWKQPSLAYYSFSSSIPESNTSSTTYQTKLTHTFTITETGNYRISCAYSWRTSVLSSAFLGRMYLDDSTELFANKQAPNGVGLLGLGASSNTTSYFVVRNLSAGTHNVKIQWATDSNVRTSYISNVYVDVFKI